MDYSVTLNCGNTSRIKFNSKNKCEYEIISSKSEDNNIARVEKDFIIANNAGKTKIEVAVKSNEDEKVTFTIFVTVKAGGVRVSVKPKNNVISVGEILKIRTMVSNGVYKSLTYQSRNMNVASVESEGGYGFVRGISEGTAIIDIRVNVGNIICEEKVEVNVKPVKKEELPISNPVDASNYNEDDEWKGSRVFFGVYEQDGNLKNGKEPILWRVLEISDDTILLLSEFGLVCKYYHDVYEHVTWETSYIRKWLNTKFLDSSFTKSEINAIKENKVITGESKLYQNSGGKNTLDKVFLLPKKALENPAFGFMKDLRKRSNTRTVKITKHALKEGGYRSKKNNNTCWWLRSPGITNQYASYVLTSGRVTEAYFSGRRNDAIRPAIRIKRSEVMSGDELSNGIASYPRIIVKEM